MNSKREQNNKLTKERAIEQIMNNIIIDEDNPKVCSYDCYYMDYEGQCCLNKWVRLECNDSYNRMRTESCLVLKPILSDLQTLKDFHNKLLSNQKQNDMPVDVDGIIFNKEVKNE